MVMDQAGNMAARLDELMAEIGWVRRLARALINDVAAADDIAQDAWVLAIRHPPTDARPLRPWLRRVVLNVARMRYRTARRRDAREAATERGDVPTPADLVERVQLQRAVADEVLALTEPFRSTVLLHFVEGLSSAQIARRLGVPDGTVRRRLKVAVDQLRERLRSRGDGPKRGWLVALVPLARSSERPPAVAALGGVAIEKLIAGVVLVLLLLIGVVGWWRRGDRSELEGTKIVEGERASAPTAGRDLQQAATIPPWIPQIGVSGRRIAGRVRFAGRPVGGATVRLALMTTPEAVQPVAELRAGPDGAFDFGVQPAASFAVSAEAPKLTSSSTVISVADPRATPDQIVLELGGCRSRLYGSVVDASGGSIAKARLLSAERGGTESDATGRYSLCLPDGNSRVRVEADGYGTVALPFRLFGEFHYDVVLVPEAVLVGQVVADGSRPIAGARVIATPDDIDWLHHVATGWATTDRDGRFQITGLAPGRFRVHASADELGMGTPQLVVARPATSSHELRLVLEGVAQVRGRVKMAGRPVSGARIIASHEGAPSDAVSFSQPDGSFVLSGVPFGINVFAAPPYEVRSPTSLAITRAVVDDVVLDVGAMATLRGHVIRKGEPVAGASVGRVGSPTHAKTDPSGGFVLEGLPPGDQRIYAASAELFAFADNLAVTLAIGEDRTLDIELDRAGRAKGTVVDEDGKPVPNAYVQLEPASSDRYQGQSMNRESKGESMTDVGGAFDCGAMSGGDYLPAVYPSPLAGRPFPPASGERLEAIHVPRDGTVTGIRLAIKHERLAIRGKVVDDLGADVSDVYVQAIGRGRVATMLQRVMSDAAGRFVVGDLARGIYSLHARGADGSETEVFNVPAGSEAVTVMLGRPGAIKGTLIGFSTTPIVALQNDTPDLTTGSRAIVERDRFSALGVPPGHYTVQAKAGVDVDGQAVEVRPGQTIRLTLRSRGLGKIAGRVTEYGSKAPVTGMRCDGNLSMGGMMGGLEPDPALQAFTDAAGRFSVSAPIGRVRVFCFSPNGDRLSNAGTDVDVTSTGIPTVDLIAVRNTAGAVPGDPGFGIERVLLPLTVDRIDPGGPAASSGLAIGDHLVAIGGATLQGMLPMGAMFLLGNQRPGTTVTIGIERGGAVQTIKIVIGRTRDWD
jgi:RNA polymerase sigma factor (sigma-70 family)